MMCTIKFPGVFSVDALLNKSQQRSEHGLWQWRDDRGVWHSYSWIDSKIIEAAYQSGEDELSLATMGRTYTIDFNAMQQVTPSRPDVIMTRGEGPFSLNILAHHKCQTNCGDSAHTYYTYFYYLSTGICSHVDCCSVNEDG